MPRRYIIALVIIAIVFFGIVGLLISLINNNRSSVKTADKVVTTQAQNQSIKDVRSVEYTTYGRVVSNQERRAIRIQISASVARIQILQGYNETVISEQETPNVQSAFEALIFALDSAKYFQYDRSITLDERSVCSTGQRYVYGASYLNNEAYRSWSTSCGTNSGNFRGNPALVRTLMQAQFPNYSSFTSGVTL